EGRVGEGGMERVSHREKAVQLPHARLPRLDLGEIEARQTLACELQLAGAPPELLDLVPGDPARAAHAARARCGRHGYAAFSDPVVSRVVAVVSSSARTAARADTTRGSNRWPASRATSARACSGERAG